MSKAKKSKVAIPGVIVISGKDDFLVGGECDRVIDDFLPVEHRAMCLYQPKADEANITEVLDELRTAPFLADRRVVVIKGAEKFITEHRPILERYFDEPSPTGLLVLTVGNWRANTKLAKQLPQIGRHVDTGQIKPWELGSYVCRWARDKFGKSMSGQTAGVLVELVGDEPGALVSEVEKLAVYVGQRKTIKTDDVEALIGYNRMYDAFGVIDAMTRGDSSAAVERLRNLFDSDKNAEYTIVGAFAYHVRKMFQARALLDKGLNQEQVAKKAQVWKNKDAFFAQVRKISLEKIGAMLSAIANIDHSVKTGGAATRVAMEMFVVKAGLALSGPVS